MDAALPAEAAYDILVTGPALRGLASIGVRAPAAARPADAIDIRFAPGTRHIVDGAEAIICDRDAFRHALHQAATDAGATPLSGTVTALTPTDTGHDAEITTPHGPVRIKARHVILAVGSASPLTPPALPHASGTTTVQRFTPTPPHSPLPQPLLPHPTLALPAPEPTRTPTASCVWALPAPNGDLTIGTTHLGPPSPPETLIATALQTLTTT
ncbi:MAG TPA: hypothetical protein VGL93_14720, partial [Streptosporangiaceae bacterium]